MILLHAMLSCAPYEERQRLNLEEKLITCVLPVDPELHYVRRGLVQELHV